MRTVPFHVRPALTLIEVLAATALLALVAGTCASLIRAASNESGLAPPASPSELAEVADVWMDPAEKDGPSPIAGWLRSAHDDVVVPWPGDSGHPDVHLHRILSSNGAADHDWIEFECSGVRLWRWVHAEPEKPESRR